MKNNLIFLLLSAAACGIFIGVVENCVLINLKIKDKHDL